MYEGVTHRGTRRRVGVVVAALAMMVSAVPATAIANDGEEPSRRGLAPGVFNAESAMTPNIEHLSFTPRTEQAADRTNSDMAFLDGHVVVGNYGGFNIYDMDDPTRPRLVTTVNCPGNQHDVTVDGDLLFLSVQTYNTSYTDCTLSQNDDNEPFAGMRVFDISDKSRPQLVANVQTCRGSHTHTMVPDPNGENVYLYVSGTSGSRNDGPGAELGCRSASSGNPPLEDDSRWRIDIVEVPIDAPHEARLLDDGPRLFAEGEGDDYRINGLQQAPPAEYHPSGPDHRREGRWSPSPITDACHDMTAYPDLGILAGACEGNGLLVDISDPANPTRIAAVADPNFAYWHSATFSNEADKVIFTDEWGGGGQGLCTENESQEWGANGIYTIDRDANGDITGMTHQSYYKIPPHQEWNEICVAHNGNLIPVPGRDIMVQAWYQGGLTVWEFTDPANPVELAWFDRGPIQTDPEGAQQRGGFWSAYWYDGLIYGADITRGLDVFRLHGDDILTQAELDAADAWDGEPQLNPQTQYRYDTAVVEPVEACEQVEPTTFLDSIVAAHRASVGCLGGFGIAAGYVDGTYNPTGDVTRAQMASFLTRALRVAGAELPEPPAEAFPDVDNTGHDDAIGQLAALGVTLGRGDGTYDPSASVSRAEMATFILRTVEAVLGEQAEAPRGPFTDLAAGSGHNASIDAVYHLGIAQGTSPTTFAPDNDVRRDQMGSFLARMLGVMDEAGVELTPLPR